MESDVRSISLDNEKDRILIAWCNTRIQRTIVRDICRFIFNASMQSFHIIEFFQRNCYGGGKPKIIFFKTDNFHLSSTNDATADSLRM